MQAHNEQINNSNQNTTNPDMSLEAPNHRHVEITELPSDIAWVPMSVRDRIYDHGIPESPLNY
jgi:hypothetical protein